MEDLDGLIQQIYRDQDLTQGERQTGLPASVSSGSPSRY